MTSEKTIYTARGKIMITGEYIVLKGGDCLARPTKLQQRLDIKTSDRPGTLNWTSFDEKGAKWFEWIYDWQDSENIKKKADHPIAKTLSEIIHLNIKLNNDNSFFKQGIIAVTQLDWPRDWGLGSSSTLIANISQWLKTDPFVIQKEILGGSGYDIACAMSDDPILFQLNENKPVFSTIKKNGTFDHHACFVYQGQKADTQDALRRFKASDNTLILQDTINRVNQVTQELITGDDPQTMMEAIREHESAIAGLISATPVHHTAYKDFKGGIKSCGAWGGDFALFLGKEPAEFTRDWVREKYGLIAFAADELLV